LAAQSLIRRYWFGLFVSIVATLIAWVVASIVFVWATTQPLVAPGQWSSIEAFLVAALIAQCVSRVLVFKRRLTGGN
jgi:hypothetical protein